MFTVNKHPTVGDLRKFGWAMLIGFAVLGVAFWTIPVLWALDASLLAWLGPKKQIAAICLWVLGPALCVLSLAAPGAAKPVYVVWMTVAVAIGTVMSTVALTVLFLLFLPTYLRR